jgi:hypothetical protein
MPCRKPTVPRASGRADSRVETGSRENPLSIKCASPVPETDTRGRVEHTEALERFIVKELGKLPP